jgi:hypothetical protein
MAKNFRKRSGNDDSYSSRNSSKDSSSRSLPVGREQRNFPDHRDGSKENRSTNRSIEVYNFSLDTVTTEKFNQNFLTSNYLSTYKRDSEVVLTVVPRLRRLVYQAICWSQKIISIPDIHFKSILDGSQARAWEQQLAQLYIYSYFDALYSVLWRSEKNMIGSENTYVIGHCIMASAINKPIHSFTSEEHSCTFRIEFSNDDIDSIEKVVSQIGWLQPLVQNRFGEKYIYCPTRTRQLTSLSEALAGKTDSPALVRFTPGSANSLDTFGRYLTMDNFPIGNSFYDSVNSEKFWYIPGVSHLNRNSMLFGKGLFFSFKRASFNIVESSAFSSLPANDSGRLIRFELEHTNGCSFRDVSVFPEDTDPFTKPITYNGSIEREFKSPKNPRK